jgi:uncharacterized protein
LSGRPATPHYPYPAPIEGYGRGGFRFAGMSHRGSLLCLPSGVWAWPVTAPEDIGEGSLEPVFREAGEIGLFLLGTGTARFSLPDALRLRFHAAGMTLEIMRTGEAANTYSLLLEERRRVACGLIAVP